MAEKAKSSRWRKVLVICSVVVGIIVAMAWPYARQALMVATGYSAKRLCSEVYIAQRSPEDVWEVDLTLLPRELLSYTMMDDEKIVETSALGLVSQKAVFREGLGCTLTNGTTVARVQAMTYSPPKVKSLQDDIEWPLGKKVNANLPAGVDSARLEAALDLAFEEPDPENNPVQTRAVVVVYDGKIVAERYGEGFDKTTPLLSWSMGKSVTNSLIGLLVKKGLLDVNKPAPLKMWQGLDDGHEKITTDDILRMRSGLAFDETYGAFGDVTDMLYASYAYAERTGSSPVKQGEAQWYYSSGDTNLLTQIVRDVLADDARYHAFPTEELFHKINIHGAVFETDPSGTFVGSSYVYMTARDWARWGLLYLQDGMWNGERILPEGWVDYSCSLTPGTPLGEYGAQFWLNRGNPEGSENRKFPSVPVDYCAAQGFETQRVAMIPSRKAVIVRLGLTPKRGGFPEDKFFAAVLDALPGS